jgi:hypothetical protein
VNEIRAELDRQSPWPLEITEHSLGRINPTRLTPSLQLTINFAVMHSSVFT